MMTLRTYVDCLLRLQTALFSPQGSLSLVGDVLDMLGQVSMTQLLPADVELCKHLHADGCTCKPLPPS
jgi:hypothetical protein